jgi:hypothetical protein
VTQKQLGEQIAVRQHEHRRPGPEREKVIAVARQQWPRRISAWKKGDRLPATLNELFLALDVIAPDTARGQWEQWWHQACGLAQVDVGTQGPLLPSTRRRSAYLQQVARIAPPELIAREDELAELTAFCLADADPGPSQYMWLRAPA